ncbi:MAG: hypothetical protein KUG68_03590 [Flavobacteriaceae bacterium]|nr:hypothetical protein [Flavobacteriaceae bacterium]
MKVFTNNTKLLMFLIISVLFISCSSDDNDDVIEDDNLSIEDTTRAAQVDNIVENSLNIMENGYVESEEGRASMVTFFPACTTITINPDGAGGGMIVLDFGDSCTLNNGSVVSGKINLTYNAIVNGSRTIQYNYENFTYNTHGVSGGGTVLREIENDNGNPQSTVNETITVNLSNTDITATREAFRIAEWTEGVGSGTWTDNVYSVTGNWETTFSNGFSRSGEVITPLIRKLSCIYLVSGRIEITQQLLTGAIDFGDGECDNLATLIFNGQEFPIIIGG